MIIINNSQGDWWEARLTRSVWQNFLEVLSRIKNFKLKKITTSTQSNNNTGYVPSNYVAPAESLEAQDWFCGMIRRAEAERSLANKAPGTFLIREAETAIGCYSMSGERVFQNVEFFNYRTMVERIYRKSLMTH